MVRWENICEYLANSKLWLDETNHGCNLRGLSWHRSWDVLILLLSHRTPGLSWAHMARTIPYFQCPLILLAVATGLRPSHGAMVQSCSNSSGDMPNLAFLLLLLQSPRPRTTRWRADVITALCHLKTDLSKTADGNQTQRVNQGEEPQGSTQHWQLQGLSGRRTHFPLVSVKVSQGFSLTAGPNPYSVRIFNQDGHVTAWHGVWGLPDGPHDGHLYY